MLAHEFDDFYRINGGESAPTVEFTDSIKNGAPIANARLADGVASLKFLMRELAAEF